MRSRTVYSFMVVSKPPFSLDNLFEASVPYGIKKVPGLSLSLDDCVIGW